MSAVDASDQIPDRIERTDEGAIMVVRLVNDGAANALTESMLRTLAKQFEPEASTGIRAAILTGAGDRHFCSGAEMGSDTIDRWSERIKRIEQGLSAVATAMTKAPFPTIAAINGDAIGGGLELAMSCDWRIARDGARFAMPPARLGLVYTADGIRRFVQEVGPARAREIFLAGRVFDARHAASIGVINHVVSEGEVMAVARKMASAVASNAPLAVEGMRVVLRAIQDDEANAHARAQQYRVRAFGSRDLAEGVSAARERRPPEFSGE